MRFLLPTAATLAAVFLVSPSALSQVEVIESSPTTIRPIGQPRNNAGNTANAPAAIPVQSAQSIQTEMYYQLQTLQQEVATLRGIIEEQSYELSRLKQQRTDDYADLDRRLSELSNGAVQGGSASASSGVSSRPTNTASTPTPMVSNTAPSLDSGEYESYRSVRSFLSAKQYDEARAVLQTINHPTATQWLQKIDDLDPIKNPFAE